MATITTINAGDGISPSRTVINTNFSNLNTDKIETSVIDVDTTLAANSDAKIPSQKAVKAFVEALGFGNASTTAKGVVEEATQAEVNAGTSAGATGARLFVNPSTLHTTCLSLVPNPNGVSDAEVVALAVNNNTTGYVGQVVIPFKITANKLSIRTTNITVADTVDVTMYSEDGQTQIFSVTSGTLTADAVQSITLSSVTIYPGVYYVLLNGNGSINGQIYVYRQNALPFSTTAGLLGDVASEPVLRGTLVISAGTPPATITPTSITDAVDGTLVFRLDN